MLLAKEAKFEHGLNKTEYDYEDVMNTIRENDLRNNDSKIGEYKTRRIKHNFFCKFPGIKGSWARRISRLSDGLDAHVEVVSRTKKNSITTSTVWECS